MSCSNFNPDIPSSSSANSSGTESHKNNSGENNDGKKSVTVLISDTGEITYDEETLQSIIDSDQELTTVTFLRVEGSKNSKDNDCASANIATTDISNQGLSGSLNEDSMDAANAILDAASINPTADQGISPNEIVNNANNPIAMLNQEQISRLEKVLQSDEAKTFLGDVLGAGNSSNMAEGEIAMMPNLTESDNMTTEPITQGVEQHTSEPDESISQKTNANTDDIQTSSSESDVDKKKTVKGRGNLTRGARRSQRQIDKEMKEEAERIKKENQALLQKEREQMKSSSSTASSVTEEAIDEVDKLNLSQESSDLNKPDPEKSQMAEVNIVSSQSQASNRPKRERKIPLHMQGGDFLYGPAGTQKESNNKKTVEKLEKKSDFKLSKILPSPNKTLSSHTPKRNDEISKAQTDSSQQIIDDTSTHEKEDDVEEKTETEEETSDGDWNSEDDPERLWCICQQPHNNRFMICCDSCLDWYHGKCVGITKKMGKEMEDAGNEWRCPTCKKKQKISDTKDKVKIDLEQKIEAKVQKEHEKQLQQEKRSPNKSTNNTKGKASGLKKRPGSAMSNDGKEEKKIKERTCFVCEKPPRTESIFCSDECIGKHVDRAKEFLMKTKPKSVSASKRPELPSTFPGTDKASKAQRVMVMEPKTNTLISASAPNAPTEETLSTWLKNHPTFHVVMPKDVPTSKFYGIEKAIQKKANKPPVMSIERQKQRLKEKANIDKRLKEYQKQPASMISTQEMSISHSFTPTLEGKPAPTQMSIVKTSKTDDQEKQVQTPENVNLKRTPSSSTSLNSEEKLQRSISGSSISSSERRKRRPSDDYIKKRRDSESKSAMNRYARQIDYVESDFDPTPLRKNVTKGLKDALKTRVENTEGVTISDDELDKLVKNIEDSLYKYYNKDVGTKYKSKYRSLVFNIKDQKNNGLFRKIVRKEYSPSRIVSMTAEEMANKQLKEWRQAELKHDIEKIKSHEMEMAQIGTKLVMKTHKGDMVMEDGKESSMVELKNDEVMLPDEVKLEEINASTKSFGLKTWEHGSHGFESQCDVCTAKITLDEFLLAKIDREKKQSSKKSKSSEHKSSSKSSSSSSHHHKRSREDSDKRRRSSSSHGRHSSSSRHKSKEDSSDNKEKDVHDSKNQIERDANIGKEFTSSSDKKEKTLNENDSGVHKIIVGDPKTSERKTDKHASEHRSSSHRRDSQGSSSSHKRRHSSTRDKSHSSSSKSRKDSNLSDKDKDRNKELRSSHSSTRNEKAYTSSDKATGNDAFTKSKTSKSGNDTSKLKGTVSDGDELTRKEVTEEDVAKAESLIKKITSSSAIIQNIPEYDEGSEAIPNLSSDIEQAESSANDSITEIVSSTVTIKTPDTSGLNVGSDTNPIVWKGDIHMPDVAKFSVTAKQVSGTTDYLTVDLKDSLKIVGRIAPQTVWDYITQISESPSKEILLVRLEPSTDDETNNYSTFFNYLQSRKRLGVVGNNSKMVKDCYLLPLSATDNLNRALLPLDGPGIEESRPDMLLALVVRTRRKRPGDTERDAEKLRLQLYKKSKNETARSATDIITLDHTGDKRITNKGGTGQMSDDEMQYDPAMAGTWPLNDSPTVQENINADKSVPPKNKEEDEIYDPESANFSPEDEPSSSQSPSNVSMSEKMARINQQIEREKAEIAIVQSKMKDSNVPESRSTIKDKEKSKTVNIAGFQGLPTGIASILFGEASSTKIGDNVIPGLGDITEDAEDAYSSMKDPRRSQTLIKASMAENPKPTSLSSLSDAELLEKAAAQMPTSQRNVSNQDILHKTKNYGVKQSQYFPSGNTDITRSISEKNIWQQQEEDRYYDRGVERNTMTDNQPSPWMTDGEQRGGMQRNYRDLDGRHTKSEYANKGSDWHRSSRHGFRSEDSHRSHSDAYDYNSPGHRRSWQGSSKDNWSYNQGHHFEERGRKDNNCWRDRDMRRENHRDYSSRNSNRERDYDYRFDRNPNQTRYLSSRSKSRDDDLKPPGDERNFDTPFDRSETYHSRSRSPIDKISNLEPIQSSSSTQSLDERIANVVNRLPN